MRELVIERQLDEEQTVKLRETNVFISKDSETLPPLRGDILRAAMERLQYKKALK